MSQPPEWPAPDSPDAPDGGTGDGDPTGEAPPAAQDGGETRDWSGGWGRRSTPAAGGQEWTRPAGPPPGWTQPAASAAGPPDDEPEPANPAGAAPGEPTRPASPAGPAPTDPTRPAPALRPSDETQRTPAPEPTRHAPTPDETQRTPAPEPTQQAPAGTPPASGPAPTERVTPPDATRRDSPAAPPGWEAPGAAPQQQAPQGWGAPDRPQPRQGASGWGDPAPGQPQQGGGQGWYLHPTNQPDDQPLPWEQGGTPPAGPPPQPPQQGWGTPTGGWGHNPAGWAPRPKPGIIPLRPIGLGEIYDGAFQAIRTNPRTMIGISAVVIAVTSLLTTVPQAAALTSFGGSDLFDPEAAEDLTTGEIAASFTGLMSSLLIPALLQALAITVVSGLLIIAVSNAVLGQKTAPGVLWERTRKRALALIGLSVLVLVASMAIAALFLTPGILVLVADGDTLLGVLLILFGVVCAIAAYIVLFYGFWSLAPPALLLENLSVMQSLARSARLVRRSFWRVLGIMLLTTLLVSVVSGFISVPFALVSTAVGYAQDPPNSYSSFPLTLLQLLVQQIGTVLSGAILYPLSAAVTALLYIDIRMRTEGLDVELMRATGDLRQ